jgi:hypothetical protein
MNNDKIFSKEYILIFVYTISFRDNYPSFELNWLNNLIDSDYIGCN